MVMALQLPYNPNRGCLSNGRGCSVIEYEKAKTVATTTTTPATNARFVPFTSNHSLADRIEAANIAIRSQAESRGLSFIDLNPLIATQGIRKLDMTTDGVHFTRKACLVWVDEIHQKINSFDAR